MFSTTESGTGCICLVHLNREIEIPSSDLVPHRESVNPQYVLSMCLKKKKTSYSNCPDYKTKTKTNEAIVNGSSRYERSVVAMKILDKHVVYGTGVVPCWSGMQLVKKVFRQ